MPFKKSSVSKEKRSKDDFLHTLENIETVVRQIPDEYDYIFKPGKHLLFSFFRGMVQALGVALGFAIVIPFVIWFLGQVSWVPLVGDFVMQVRDRVENTQDYRQGIGTGQQKNMEL